MPVEEFLTSVPAVAIAAVDPEPPAHASSRGPRREIRGGASPRAPSDLGAPVAIADVSVHPVSFEEAVDWIAYRAASGSGGVVVTPNADYVVRARDDLPFRAAIMSGDLRVPDGMAIVYAARLAGRRLRRSVTGRLLVPALAKRAAAEGWALALYGARPGVAAAAGAALTSRYPDLQVSHAISPPMDLEVGSNADTETLGPLNGGNARVIFVALGAPLQEHWMDRHRAELSGSVLVGVGDALDILAGRFREAPRWMTRVGLEWLFRLAQEPRRLAPRYLARDPWIFLWALRTRLGRRARTRQAPDGLQQDGHRDGTGTSSR